MQASSFTLTAPDGAALFVYRWLPDGPAKALVQVAHGLSEHGGRYARLAQALTDAGYAVYAGDHRGHGRSVAESKDLGFFAARGGWRLVVEDLWRLNRRIAADHPGLPIVLVGHSMGSFIAQDFISEHGNALAGVVLSGSDGKPPALAALGRLVARIERLRLGPHGHSGVMHGFSFGAFNKPFAPTRTAFDWLSRDPAEVDKYAADPLCGFPASVQLWIDMLDALGGIADPRRQVRIPKTLPILVISGSRDAVSRNTKGLEQLLAAYQNAGLQFVTHRFYPEGRHELFNEINRDEVTHDVIAWLDNVVAR